MSFQRQTFLGASIRGYTSRVSWGTGGPSTLTVGLVEDPANGDSFEPQRVGSPQVGHPIYFEHGGFKFGGLIQRWVEEKGRDGKPVFQVECVDPRELLDGAQVITGGYNGTTGSVPNLLNVFGWWENQGYGSSGSSETGMPWNKVLAAVKSMVNLPANGPYGGPIQFRGYTYSLDLSQMPVTHPDYRVPVPSMSLMDLIAQVCLDCGCDFIVELVGLAILVRVVSRAAQPPLGTISALVNNAWSGKVIRSQNGLECRNEQTSSFLVGGEISTLHMTSGIQSFWGFDFDGSPITPIGNVGIWTAKPYYQNGQAMAQADIQGSQQPNEPPMKLVTEQPQDVAMTNQFNEKFGFWRYARYGNDSFEVMNLNSSSVADLLGNTSYNCTTMELRLAKISYEAWSMFMTSFRSQLAQMIGVNSLLTVPEGGIGQLLGNGGGLALVNDGGAIQMAQAAVATDTHARAQRMYEFVRGVAEEYLGKRFLVSVPFVLYNRDSETLQMRSSYDVSDGGYLPEDSAPLGLSLLNEDFFKTPDNRFVGFVRYENVLGMDATKIPLDNVVIENNVLFARVQVDPGIVYAPSPCVVITVPGAITARATDAMGDLGIIRQMLQVSDQQNQQFINELESRFVNLRISPAPQFPSVGAVPLKSNVLTYGPWVAIGATGKTRVEMDPSLTPWSYGGYAAMNSAATARVVTATTNMQIGETAQAEIEGLPTISLGDVMSSGGPNLTGIDVNIGPQGVSTTYQFATFTAPRSGMSKQAIDRMRRLSLTGVELRKAFRASVRSSIAKAGVADSAARSARAYMDLAPAAFRRASPHEVLTSFSQFNPTTGRVLTTTQTSTYEEALTLTNADKSDEWRSTAVMHLNGLLRPFCTAPSGGSSNMPTYTTPTVTGNVPNRTNLDPWKDANDIPIWAWGTAYSGLHAYRRHGDHATARPMALRGPIVLAGWGYDITGKCYPSSDNGATWDSDTLMRQDKWKVGPVDILWNNYSGTYTVHGTVKGFCLTSIPANGSGNFRVTVTAGSGWDMAVHNHFSTAVSSGAKAICVYIPTDNRWYVSAADCV